MNEQESFMASSPREQRPLLSDTFNKHSMDWMTAKGTFNPPEATSFADNPVLKMASCDTSGENCSSYGLIQFDYSLGGLKPISVIQVLYMLCCTASIYFSVCLR